MGTFGSGEPITPTPGVAGEYKFALTSDQFEEWDISVTGVSSPGGRLHSPNWWFFTGGYEEEYAFTGSFYALVSAGGEAYTSVVELKTEGLSGREWNMAANTRGVDGAGSGRSQIIVGNSYTPEFPIYINPPAKAAYEIQAPVVGDLTLNGGVTGCAAVAPGWGNAFFTFESSVSGNYHLVCDLNDDGIFDVAGDDDLAISGNADAGENRVPWDGTDNSGRDVQPGSFECQVTITVGEFHYIAGDVETAYKGLRLFQVLTDGTRTPLDMYWNDEAVFYEGETMPNGEEPLASSGPDGVNSGNYGAAAVPNTNSRAWGDFTMEGNWAPSKGDGTYLDTFTWLEETVSGSVTVTVLDDTTDSDGDGWTDIEELCKEGTDPYSLAGYYHGGCSTLPGAGSAFGVAAAAWLSRSRRRR
jgi:hypothetical protein